MAVKSFTRKNISGNRLNNTNTFTKLSTKKYNLAGLSLKPPTVDYIVVAGGGGGGGNLGGGGGGGGVLTATSYSIVPEQAYTITVGAGGALGTGNTIHAGNGNFSSFSLGAPSTSGIYSYGGGGGGNYASTASANGYSGGSGGGGPGTGTSTTRIAGSGVYPGSAYINSARQGYNGGAGLNQDGHGAGGGGGGGGAIGATGVSDVGGNGGIGYLSSVAPVFNGTGYTYANSQLLTIDSASANVLNSGTIITGSNIPYRTYITALGTGSGGVGSYTMNANASPQSTNLLIAQSSSPTVDNATTPSVITNAGSATATNSVTPFSSTYSLQFNGTSNYMTVPYTTSKFDWWTDDFSIECWIYTTTTTGWWYSAAGLEIPCLIGNDDYNTTTNYWSFGINSSRQVALYYYNGGTNYISSTSTITLSAWNHIAMVKTSAGVTLFVNGVAQTTTAISATTPQSSAATALTIGAGNLTYINGYVSNLRIIKGGSATYTSTFTVPSSALTATATTTISGSTVLLTAQSPTFIDNSPIRSTLNSFAAISATNAVIPFAGTYSYSLVNASAGTQYLTAPTNSAFAFGTGDFTIECWVRPSTLNLYNGIVDNRNSTTGFSLLYTSSGLVEFGTGTAGSATYLQSATGLVTTNTWYHIACVRASGVKTIYLNGVVIATVSGDTLNITSTSALLIGRTADVGPNYYVNGYISNFRIIKGAAIYSGTSTSVANFTVPSAPLATTQSSSTNISAISAGVSVTSNSAYFAGGGGGGAITGFGTAGAGGAGAGSITNASPGSASTGGGGGGGGNAVTYLGGNGGSGKVIIRYSNTYTNAFSTTGNTSFTDAGGYKTYTFTSSGTITF
jgi:hypothetical protein